MLRSAWSARSRERGLCIHPLDCIHDRMSEIVHARLDAETSKLLARLRRRFGWRDSEIVRRGIRALAGSETPPRTRKIVGVGRFESGVDDLGSNEEHLAGFGR